MAHAATSKGVALVRWQSGNGHGASDSPRPVGTRQLGTLSAAGFTDDELVGAGISTPTRDDPNRLIDMFRDRIIFPVRAPAGHVVGFIGRAGPHAGDVPKYLNSPETTMYDKGQLLFGFAEQHDRITAGWTPVLVEGPADALAVWLSYSRSGRPGKVALAPCGTALTSAQAALFSGLPGSAIGVVAAFDGDAAGQAAADRAWQLLRGPASPGPLLAVEFSAQADPADLLRRPNGRAQLRAALQRQTRPLLDAVVDHRLQRLLARHPRSLEDIPGRCAAARLLVPLIFDADGTDDAKRLIGHIVEQVGVGVDTVMLVALEHVESTVQKLGIQVGVEVDLQAGEPDRAGGDAVRPAATMAFPTLNTVAGVPQVAVVVSHVGRTARSRNCPK